jgi:hypothetical protein
LFAAATGAASLPLTIELLRVFPVPNFSDGPVVQSSVDTDASQRQFVGEQLFHLSHNIVPNHARVGPAEKCAVASHPSLALSPTAFLPLRDAAP